MMLREQLYMVIAIINVSLNGALVLVSVLKPFENMNNGALTLMGIMGCITGLLLIVKIIDE